MIPKRRVLAQAGIGPADEVHPETDQERVARILGERWIGYPRAQAILERLEQLLVYPKRQRMPNLLIVSDTNNGKTTIAKRFVSRHPAQLDPKGEHSHLPVVMIQAPPIPDEGRLYNALLRETYAPFKPYSRIDQRQFQVLALMKLVEVRILIIDEIHHVLAGSSMRQKHFLNVIKYLGNELQIPIVAIGTRDAFNAIHLDPQLENRFEPAWLPRWSVEDQESAKEYRRLLASFERLLHLRNPSNLQEKSMALRILAMTGGTIGEIATLLQRASIHAIQTGTEQITPRVLERCGYVVPAKRGRQVT